MHNGFNRQGMSFIPNQMGTMNRFQSPPANINRGGSMYQNSSGFARPIQNVGVPQQPTTFVRPPPAAAVADTSGGAAGIQSRLGPRTPITAPGKNDSPTASGRPVLRRPGSQDKDKNVKPAEDKAQASDMKQPADGVKSDAERTPATSAAPGINTEPKASPVAASKAAGKDSLMGSQMAVAPNKFGSPSAGRSFPAARQETAPGKSPAEKVNSDQSADSKRFTPTTTSTTSSSSPNRFGSNANPPQKSNAGQGEQTKPGLAQDRGSNAPPGRYNQKPANQDGQPPNRNGPNQEEQGQSGNKNTTGGNTSNSDRYHRGRFGGSNNEQDVKFGQRHSRFNANPNDSNQQPRDRSFDRNNSEDSASHKIRQGPGSHGNSHWSSEAASSAAASSNKEPSRRGADMNRSRGGFSQEKFWERLQELSVAQYDLEPLDMSEKKFNAQSRLFVGSLPREITLEELKEMFSKHGELGQVYFNKDGAYAFINFDYHVNAEKAMRELNSTQIRGRTIKVRFAAITTGVRVKNLTMNVTNELLYRAFSVFGAVEQSKVIVDDRGKPTGDGMVIFTEKKSAVMAYKKCQEESFFLTSQLRPVIVEPWENRDEEEGYPESGLIKNEQYKKDRKMGPRFAEPNSLESEYGKQWKQLFDLYKEKRLSLESDLKAEMDALEVKMQLVVHQQETEKLRKELAQREQEAIQLQMGLGSLRDGGPTQLSTDDFGPGFAKRPQDYYDMPDHRTPYDQPRPYDEYYHQRGGYDRLDDRAGYNGRGQAGYDTRPPSYDGRSQAYDTRGPTSYDARSHAYDARPLDGRPLDGRPIDGRPIDGRPIDGRPIDGRPIDGRPIDGRPIDGRPIDGRPIDGRPIDGRPIDGRPIDGRPIDGRPIDGRPHDARPTSHDARPHDARAPDARPLDARPHDSRPPAPYDGRSSRSVAYDSASHSGYGYDHASATPYDQPIQKQGPPPSQLPPPPMPTVASVGGYDASAAATAAAGSPASVPAAAPGPAAVATATPPAGPTPGSASEGYSTSSAGYARSASSAAPGGYGRSSGAAGGSSSSSNYGRSSGNASGSSYERAPTASGQGYEVGQQGSSPYENNSKRSRY